MAEEPQLTGRVVYPRQPEFLEERLDYNVRFSLWPRAIVFCYSARDVRNAVRWASHHRVPIRARCGRHSYEAWSLVDDGLIVDVSYMDGVKIDAAAGTATVEAGIDLYPLYQALAAEGFTIPGGSCPTVGIAGLTLGGGFGLLGRLHGLTCDSLLALEMVTAQGDVVRADETTNADLFWACRGGGGGNFGIVTSFTFRLSPAPDVSIYTLTWTWDSLADVVGAWQRWAPGADPRLTSILKLTAKQSGSVSSIGQLVGSAAELTEMLRPLVETGTPTSLEVKTMPLIEAVEYFGGLKPNAWHWTAHWHGDHTKFKNTSAYAYQPFGDDAVRALVRSLETAPNANALVQLDAYGPTSAVNQVPRDATAFYHRAGVLWNMQFQAYWTDDADQEDNIRWVEAFRRAMLPFTRGAYVNYCDIDIEDWQEAYYGDNFARLVRVKTAWDPGNVFRYPQSIPPAVPALPVTGETVQALSPAERS